MSRRSTKPAAAWLASIELENVRCFKERQVVPFTTSDGKKAQWTLLLGENGTGKSTLLQMCAVLMRAFAMPKQGFFYVPWDRFVPPQGKIIHSDVAASLHYGGESLHWSCEVTTTATGGVEFEESSFDEQPLLPPCLAYAPYRSAQAFIPEDTASTDTNGLFLGFTRLRHPADWFIDRTIATVNPHSNEKSRETASTILDRVRQTLLSVLPDVTELQLNTDLEGRGATHLIAKTPYGWVNIDSLGFGYQSILALVVDIASRLIEHYPKSPKPLEEPAVILIDEIDLHLHPKWQRTLQQELSNQFPNAQFIATAHSPLVVQSSPDANILVLRREGDHVIIERAPDVIKTWRVDQILTSDLFGLPTSRPPYLDDFIQERDHILGKSELSKADKKRLEELKDRIETIPGGETRWEMDAMELIREAAKTLEPAKKKATKRPTKKSKGRG